MQISLTQAEIEVGVKMYIQSRGIDLNNRDIFMDFTNTRKGNAGINVDVDLGEDSAYEPPATPPQLSVVQAGGTIRARRTTPFEMPANESTEPATVAKSNVHVTPAPAVLAEDTPAVEPEVTEKPVEETKKEEAPVSETEPTKEEVAPEPKAKPELVVEKRANPFANVASDTPTETAAARKSLFS